MLSSQIIQATDEQQRDAADGATEKWAVWREGGRDIIISRLRSFAEQRGANPPDAEASASFWNKACSVARPSSAPPRTCTRPLANRDLNSDEWRSSGDCDSRPRLCRSSDSPGDAKCHSRICRSHWRGPAWPIGKPKWRLRKRSLRNSGKFSNQSILIFQSFRAGMEERGKDLRGSWIVNSLYSPKLLSTVNAAAVLLRHDVVADRQTEASALAGWLGGEERLEHLFPNLGGNADSIVAYPDLHSFTQIKGRDLQRRFINRPGVVPRTPRPALADDLTAHRTAPPRCV